MPYADPDPGDPHLLVGVSLPGEEASTREMAEAFADEFAQMGFDRDRLLRLFSNPFYAGAHAARQLLGDAEITRIVEESLRAYGGRACAVRDADDDEPEAPGARRGSRSLRVL
jgi:hypothetical protein